jgi:methylenetetrahydrofolate reductase (NADPH)
VSDSGELGRIEAKLHVGVDFLQTQPVFDIEGFRLWLESLRASGLLGRVRILAGMLPLRGAGSAHYLPSRIPGVSIPESLIERLEKAESEAAEGIDIAVETARQIIQLPGVDGLHIMAGGGADAVPLILDALSLTL